MAWGYHDQTPMIAWAINLSTSILGHTEFGVRLPSVLAMTIASAYMIMIAVKWVSPLAAFQTAVLTQSILEFNVGGLLATPDGLQAAAWAGAAYHVARAYEDGKWSQWLTAGLWFGFGMLSKYTMVIFLPGAFLYGLFFKNHREKLANIRPYIGVLIGFIMFMPVMVWNSKNSWNSFRHVAYIGGANEIFTLNFKYLGEYVASQAGLLSPLVFVLMLFAWFLALRKKSRAKNWIYPYLFFTSFPMVAGFALLSLHSRVYGNWPGAGYITGSLLIVSFFAGKPDDIMEGKKLGIGRKIWPWAVGTSYLITGAVLLQCIWPVLPIPIKMDRTATEISGWQELGKTANDMLKSMPDPDKTFLFGLKYQHASQLAFYTPGNPRTVSINKWSRPNVYDYWLKDEDIIGWDAVGVAGKSKKHKKRFEQVFERVDPPVQIKIFRKNVFQNNSTDVQPIREFYLYRAYGFKGGLRWVPNDRSDIRAN